METVEGCGGRISKDVRERTVHFHLFGRRAAFVSRSQFLESLKGTGVDDFVGMWKAESSFEVFVTFRSVESALRVKEVIGEFKIGEVCVFASSEEDVLNDVRVHWAPLHVEDCFFNEYFEKKGFKIISSRLERDFHDGLFNGVRLYRLIGKKATWDDLPHVVNFKDLAFQTLLKVTGRLPLCLKCRKLGHQRAQCDQNRAAQFVSRQYDRKDQTAGGESRQEEGEGQKKPPPRRWEMTQLTVLGASAASSKNRTTADEPVKEAEKTGDVVTEETKGDMTLSSDEEEEDATSLKTVEDMEEGEIEEEEDSGPSKKGETEECVPAGGEGEGSSVGVVADSVDLEPVNCDIMTCVAQNVTIETSSPKTKRKHKKVKEKNTFV